MDRFNLIEKLQKRDVSNILSDVKRSLSGAGHAHLAQRALVKICNLASVPKNGETSVFSDDDCLLKVVIVCCQSIAEDSKNDVGIPSNSRTILSLYNILYRFSQNNAHCCVVELIESCLPILERMVPTMSEADTKAMKNYSILLYNVFRVLDADVYKMEVSSTDKLSLPLLWKLMLRLSSVVEADLILLLNLLKSLLVKYGIFHNSDQEKSKVSKFTHILCSEFELFCKNFATRFPISKPSAEKIFSVMIACERSLLMFYMKSSNVKGACQSFSCVTSCVHTLLSSYSNYINYWNLASKVFNAFIFSFDCPPLANDLLKEVEECWESLQALRMEGKSSLLDLICCLLGTTTEWASCYPSSVIKHYTYDLFSSVYRFTELLAKHLLYGVYVSNVSEGVEAKNIKNFCGAYQCLKVPACIAFKKPVDGAQWKDVLNLTLTSLRLRQNILQDAAHDSNTDLKQLSGIYYEHVYFLGYCYYKEKIWNESKELMLEALRHYIKDWACENNHLTSFPKPFIFTALAMSFKELEQWPETRAAILLPMLLDKHAKNKPDTFLSQTWSALQDKDPVHAKTSLQFLKGNFALVQSMFPSFCRSKDQDASILLWELKCYASYRVSSIEPIMGAWLAFQGLTAPKIVQIEGSALTLRALLISGSCSWDKFDSLMSEDTSNVLSEIIQEQRVVALFFLALQAQSVALLLARKNSLNNTHAIVDYSNYVSSAKKIVHKPEDVENPDDTCIVMNQSVVINSEEQVITKLTSALEYWENALSEGLLKSENDVLANSGDYMVETAFMFTLFGNNSSAARAWIVCRKFAKLMARNDLQLQALSGLMNTIKCNSKWIEEADMLSERVLDHPRCKYLLLVYLTSRAFYALQKGDLEEGFSFLSRISDEAPRSQSTLWCFVFGKFLEAQYALSKNFRITKNKRLTPPLLLARSALQYAIDDFKRKDDWLDPVGFCTIVDQMLRISLWLGKMYRQSKLPRQARAFLKTEFVAAQRLGLVTRAAEFLCELVQVDLICEKADDAEMKMDVIDSMLGEKNNDLSRRFMHKSDDRIKSVWMSIEKQRSIGFRFEAVHKSYGSPNLRKPAACSEHSSSCKCYVCRNASVQLIKVMTYQMQAKILSLMLEGERASLFFKEGLKLAAKCVERLQNDPVFPGRSLLHHQFICSQAALKTDYAELLIIFGQDDKARKQNAQALALISPLIFLERNLYAEIVEQEICLSVIARDQQRASTKGTSISEELMPPLEFGNVKTPEGKKGVSNACVTLKRRALTPVSVNKMSLPSFAEQTISPSLAAEIFVSPCIDKPESASVENLTSLNLKPSSNKDVGFTKGKKDNCNSTESRISIPHKVNKKSKASDVPVASSKDSDSETRKNKPRGMRIRSAVVVQDSKQVVRQNRLKKLDG